VFLYRVFVYFRTHLIFISVADFVYFQFFVYFVLPPDGGIKS